MNKILIISISIPLFCFCTYGEDRNIEILKIINNAPLLSIENFNFSEKLKELSVYELKPIDYYRNFNKKYVYGMPDLKIELYKYDDEYLKQFSKKMLDDVVAHLLGKIDLGNGNFGIVMLESGYYSMTRVIIYPIDKDGKIMPGLEVSDKISDEEVEITIKSKLSNSKIETFIEKKTFDQLDQSHIEKSERKKVFWEFEKKRGFIKILNP
jgi:hypothetical protein